MALYRCTDIGSGGGSTHTDEFYGVRYSGSNNPRVLYERTATKAETIVFSGAWGFTNCSNNEGFIEILINDVQVDKSDYMTRDAYANITGLASVTLAQGDVLKIRGNWDGTHTNIQWIFACNMQVS